MLTEVAVLPNLFLARTVRLTARHAASGVPEMVPVAGSSARPLRPTPGANTAREQQRGRAAHLLAVRGGAGLRRRSAYAGSAGRTE